MTATAALLAAVEIGDPLTRGSLALFPLFHELDAAPRYLSGPRSGAHLHISEVADLAVVPEMEVRNESPYPVLLLDGETLLGGLQNRIVTTSVLLAPHLSSRVQVTCVEAGRWRDEEPVRRSPRHAPPAIRTRNQTSVSRAVIAGLAPQEDQEGVWATVDRYRDELGASAPTSAMEDVHDHVADQVASLVAGTAPLPGQCGVAAAVAGQIVAVDLFDSPQTLADYWDALVASYALDASPSKGPSLRRRDVRRLFGAVAAADTVTAADREHAARDDLAATALLLEGAVVHLAVAAAA